MQVRFIGPNTERAVPVGPRRVVLCRRGEAVEVPDDIGAGLIRQSVWERVEPEPEPEKPVTLADRTVPELRAMADEMGIEVPSGTVKAEIIELIETAGEEPDGETEGSG